MVKFIRTDKKKHSKILEFANNHMGDLSLFKKMVDDYCSVKDDFVP